MKKVMAVHTVLRILFSLQNLSLKRQIFMSTVRLMYIFSIFGRLGHFYDRIREQAEKRTPVVISSVFRRLRIEVVYDSTIDGQPLANLLYDSDRYEKIEDEEGGSKGEKKEDQAKIERFLLLVVYETFEIGRACLIFFIVAIVFVQKKIGEENIDCLPFFLLYTFCRIRKNTIENNYSTAQQ